MGSFFLFILGSMVMLAGITAAIVIALPRVLDALLFYFNRRVEQLNKEAAIQKRKLEIMQAQYDLQEGKRPRR